MAHKTPTQAQIDKLIDAHVADRYVRHECEQDPLVGLENLHDDLVRAARAYEVGPSEQRDAVCEAIIAVTNFLKGQGFGLPALAPLRRVHHAIFDLCRNNHPDPLFSEKMKPGKSCRDMKDAVRQGQLAALADCWLRAHADGEGGEDQKLNRAARALSGAHFGKLEGKALQNARSYTRQAGPDALLTKVYIQMFEKLESEADSVGGGAQGRQLAIATLLKFLNKKAESSNP